MTWRSSSGSRSTASWKAAHSSSVSGLPDPSATWASRLAGVGPVGVVVGPEPLGAVVAAGQVDQLPADLGRRQVVEVPDALGPDLGQAPVQPHEGGLEQVVGLLPAPDVRVAPEHGTGQGHEPPLGQRDQPVTGRAVAGPEPVRAGRPPRWSGPSPRPPWCPGPDPGGRRHLTAATMGRAAPASRLALDVEFSDLPGEPMSGRCPPGAIGSRILLRGGGRRRRRRPPPDGLN